MGTKWIAHSKGGPGREAFEIAVLREDNGHGIASYGWFDANKLLISHNGGPCNWPVTPSVWQHLLAVAAAVAKEMNAVEANKSKSSG